MLVIVPVESAVHRPGLPACATRAGPATRAAAVTATTATRTAGRAVRTGRTRRVARIMDGTVPEHLAAVERMSALGAIGVSPDEAAAHGADALRGVTPRTY